MRHAVYAIGGGYSWSGRGVMYVTLKLGARRQLGKDYNFPISSSGNGPLAFAIYEETKGILLPHHREGGYDDMD